MNIKWSHLSGRTVLRSWLLLALLLPTFGGKTAATAGVPLNQPLTDRIRVTLSAPAFIVSSEPSGFKTLRMADAEEAQPEEAALLPSQVVSIALPPGIDWESLAFEVTAVEKHPLPGSFHFDLDPVQEVFGLDGSSDRATIQRAQTSGPVTLLRQGQMRKWRYVDLIFSPAGYDSARHTVEWISRLTVELSFKQDPQLFSTAEMADTVLDGEAADRFYNYEQARQWYPLTPFKAVPETLALVTSNRIVSGSPKLTEYVSYLNVHGYRVLLVTENQYGSLTGDPPNGTAEKIRKWLQENYLSQQIKYVLLVGDPVPDKPYRHYAGDVPMKSCWPRFHQLDYRETSTDYYYADLTGNWNLDGDEYFCEFIDDNGAGGVDFGVEVYVSRIPVYRNQGWESELDRILTKIMNYEQEAERSWRRSALLAMAFILPGHDNAVLGESMKTDYLDTLGFASDTFYQHTQNCDSVYASKGNLINGIVTQTWAKKPYGLVTWAAHGTPDAVTIGHGSDCQDGFLFEYDHTDSLDDTHPAFVFAASCDSGEPEWSINLGTSLLKRGGVVTYSAGGTVWGYSLNWQPDRSKTDLLTFAYYVMKRVAAGETASEALYLEKSQMAAHDDIHWMNVLGVNQYGSPTTRFALEAPLEGVPNPPAGLVLQVASSSQIFLTWTDSSNNEQGFKIERAPAGSGVWEQIATTDADAASYADNGLLCGTSYDYRVRASHSAGDSDYSNQASAATQACPPGMLFIPLLLR